MLTDIEIFVTDKEKLIYYLGNVDRVCEYLYSEISDDLKNVKYEGDKKQPDYTGTDIHKKVSGDIDRSSAGEELQ